MNPFLKPGNTVIISRFSQIKNGDVVVIKIDNKNFIKRVSKISTSLRLLGANKYFLEGDNKKESIDSREFGWIEKKDIIGKMIYKISN